MDCVNIGVYAKAIHEEDVGEDNGDGVTWTLESEGWGCISWEMSWGEEGRHRASDEGQFRNFFFVHFFAFLY